MNALREPGLAACACAANRDYQEFGFEHGEIEKKFGM
jgi:hypothetical protein